MRRLVGWSVGPFKKRVVLAFTRCNWQPFVSISNHVYFATTCCNVWLRGPLVAGFFESRVYVLMSRPWEKKDFCIRWLSKKLFIFLFSSFFGEFPESCLLSKTNTPQAVGDKTFLICLPTTTEK